MQTLRALALALLTLAVAAPDALLAPASAEAQASRSRSRSRSRSSRSRSRSRRRTTRGRTRRVGRSRGSRRRRSTPRWRTRRLRLYRGFDSSRCDYVDVDGYCVYDTGYDPSDFVVGVSLGSVTGVFPTGLQGLSHPRLDGDLDLGPVAPIGADVRVLFGVGRARLGLAALSGALGPGSFGPGWERAGDALEPGSQLEEGFFLGLYGLAAYVPQLTDEVSLWLGARAGWQLMGYSVTASGRSYSNVRRDFFSAGPEIGVRFFPHEVGLMIWAFADLAQPGFAQITAALIFESPKPRGGAFF